jgi:hypothetical protein
MSINRRRGILLVLLALAIAAELSACSTTYKEGQKVTIIGRLRLVGNEPFTHLVVTTADDKDFYLPDQSRDGYRGFIGSQVSISGTFTEKTLELADHSKSLTQYHLIDITALRAAKPHGE